MSTPLHTILSWYEDGDFPTQEQFAASWSSFYHKDEFIPMDKVDNLNAKLQDKTDKLVYQAHLTNVDAHNTTLAKLDASNLNDINIQAWKIILGVGDLPPNIATVDDPPNNVYGNVWSKQQSDALYMVLTDFVSNGKIMASKIEALGLTELISVTQTSLSAFMANNASYPYEKNDMIAIPDGAGNYSLYIYKGGTKTVSANYIPTGLTNITIAMVQGLQAALDAKLDKPSTAGNYFINRTGTTTGYRLINPASNYLLFWNGSDFTASDVYNNLGKYGVGTTTPSEMLHLNNGRIRSKAVVLDDNTETLNNQITCYNRKLLFTDSTGTKKTVLMKEDLASEFVTIPSQLNDTQKTAWKTEMNGGWTTNTMSVTAVIPPVVEKDTVNLSNNDNVNITLEGANLNLNPANFTVSICTGTSTAGNVTILETINNNKVTLLNANYINFFLNVNNYQGDYKILLFNGVATYLTDIFTISSSVNRVDLTAISWSNKTLNNVASPNMALISNGFKSFPDSNVAPVALSSQIIHKVKTVQPLFNAGDNFYLEIIVSITNYLGANSSFEAVGLSSTNVVNDLSNDLIVLSLYQFDGGSNGKFIDNPTFNYTGTQVFRIIFIKKGNVIIKRTYARLNNADIVYQVQSSISPGLDLYFGGVVTSNDNANKGLSSQIIKAYKF
ncbi:hypothetical protein IW15_10205 [Chryseobacterium soli]|uniref:Uncharacterized protein n=1 Tax=Chryseobacterium soli TaxID=445961 RepID=A0A086A8W1_9FLAO|nr:hypothetical protein [Chryseobacterium soli]KFF13125.1 hypothetical protein IW15_10205 [Chryseobacterium soli]